MSHDTAYTPVPRQHHTREITYKGRSEVAINVGFGVMGHTPMPHPFSKWEDRYELGFLGHLS